MAWAKKNLWVLAVLGLGVLWLVWWLVTTRRDHRWLERKIRKTWLNARMAEWKVKGEEAEQLHQLRRDVETEQARLGRKAEGDVERLAKNPNALVDAYRERLAKLKKQAGGAP